MDGTLIDSEPYWIGAELALAERFGATWTYEDSLTLVGNPLDVSAEILKAAGVDLPIETIIDDLLSQVTARAREHLPWMDDSRQLLEALHSAGIPCALVTMSRGAFVEAFLDEAGHFFDTVVTGDEVSRGKPDPEAYLLAAQRLGVLATDCVAIEDSAAGVRSAHASGARTIGVIRHVDVPQIDGIARVTSLAHVTVDDVRAFAHGERPRSLAD
jgi:HAD superfamily hydrolase (TIGR01509 family)